MNNHYDLEEGAKLALDYEKLKTVVAGSWNVLPAVVQDADTKDVLLIAYVNQEALER